MREIKLSADLLVSALLNLSETQNVCFLDSCAVSYLGSHLLIAGIFPVEISQIKYENPTDALKLFDRKISRPDLACIFTVSYDFGLKLENIKPAVKASSEPDVFLSFFDCLIVHDYDSNKTFLTGNEEKIDKVGNSLLASVEFQVIENFPPSKVVSNFSRSQYLSTVEKIKERIRRGDTYQTNLTQQFRASLPEELTPQQIFWRLRKSHPAPFAAFLKRERDFVVSISPERFFCIDDFNFKNRNISTSPIKGTRARGKNKAEDEFLRNQLLESRKDRAENVMIVDLLRNDLAKICKFGSVKVEKLCDLETHPTLFHLVSTVGGDLRENINFSDIIKAVFPCGSITGAPKISTMRIIDEMEIVNRGLSMGAIGYSIPNSRFQIPNSKNFRLFDSSVAIRTMVVRGREAVFNVGGGIVSDSVPGDEYDETLVKAKAIMRAINGTFIE